MASTIKPGPMCVIKSSPVPLEDGTLCRCSSGLPGTVGEKPEMNDHFVWGVDASKPLNEEGWFESRYPNLLEDSRLKLVEGVNGWVLVNWGTTTYTDQKQRISVTARDTAYANPDGSVRKVKKTDDRFATCGDIPQTPHEADKVLGSFSIDIETPITINYSTIRIAGRTIQRFDWTAFMYAEDVLGLQKDNAIVQALGDWMLKLAPSRRAKLARWTIGGEGLSYVVVSGDSLSKIAADLCGDPQKWKQIHQANRAKIPFPDRIHPGQRIVIPEELVKP